MFWKDHTPPHFHAEYNEFNAVIRIDDSGIQQGFLPVKAHALVIECADQHKKELILNWNKGIKKETFIKIEPLK